MNAEEKKALRAKIRTLKRAMTPEEIEGHIPEDDDE